MSSRFRIPDRLLAVAALAALMLCGAQSASGQTTSPPRMEGGPASTAVTTLFPGGGSPPPPDPRGKAVQGNTQAIAEGKRLFDWYNCSGCHFHGAGGIGPAFMDQQWLYGGHIDQIFASIYQGRPNGMPSWAGKIPDAQIWQIAAYVRSLADIAKTMPEPTKPTPAVAGPDTLETQPPQGPSVPAK